MQSFIIEGPLSEVKLPKLKKKERLLYNAGVMMNRQVITQKVFQAYQGKYKTLSDVLVPEDKVEPQFFVDSTELHKWQSYKAGKAIERSSKATGEKYIYKCGQMPFPDALNMPARTIITGEGGSSASRFTHIIEHSDGKYRRLMPVELERLNMFPDNFTAGASNARRGFLMGNALVVGLVEIIKMHLTVAIANASSMKS